MGLGVGVFDGLVWFCFSFCSHCSFQESNTGFQVHLKTMHPLVSHGSAHRFVVGFFSFCNFPFVFSYCEIVIFSYGSSKNV